MKKVSIIIAVYNSSNYLKKCLDSLTSQTLTDIEIITVNDGSTDNSKEIIEEYAIKDSRIKLLNKKNGGQSSARNLGLSKAIGEYVTFIDSDDYVSPKLCELSYQSAKENNSDIVIYDYYITNGENKKSVKFTCENKLDVTYKEYLFADVCPWNKLYRREFLLENDFKFPEKIIYEDYASTPTLIKYHPHISYLDRNLVYYVQSNTSTMRGKEYKTKYEDIFVASNILYNSLKDSEYQAELEYLITNHLLYYGSLNFYKYEKYELIDNISDFIKKKFPNWKKNKYLKNKNFKDKLLMLLFYKKKYNIIKLCQKIKR